MCAPGGRRNMQPSLWFQEYVLWKTKGSPDFDIRLYHHHRTNVGVLVVKLEVYNVHFCSTSNREAGCWRREFLRLASGFSSVASAFIFVASTASFAKQQLSRNSAMHLVLV